MPVDSTFQSLSHERLLGEEEVLPVLHVHDRKAAQRVLVVPGRQVTADLVVAREELRLEFHERGEPPRLGTEEEGIHEARVRLGHDRELVGAERPMRGSALDEARLEIEERLIDLQLERRDVAVLADRDGLDVPLPVLLGAEHHAAAPRRVGDTKGPLQDPLGSVESCGFRRRGHSGRPYFAADPKAVQVASLERRTRDCG